MTSPSPSALSSASTLRPKKSRTPKAPEASTSTQKKTPPATQQASAAASLGDPADLFRDDSDVDDMPLSVAQWKEQELLKKTRPATQQGPLSPEDPADSHLPPTPSATPSDDDDELPLAVTSKRKRPESVSTYVNAAKESLLKGLLGCGFGFRTGRGGFRP